MEKIEDVKRAIKKGEVYLVPCVVKKQTTTPNYGFAEDYKMDKLEELSYKKRFLEINPIINHPHSDKENGQNEIHYHLDYRFISDKISFYHKYGTEFRIKKDESLKIEYHALPVVHEIMPDFAITPVNLIKKSKIKSFAKNNKCPHRGFDLSNTKDIDGIITCPLHGLKICKKTKKVLNFALE